MVKSGQTQPGMVAGTSIPEDKEAPCEVVLVQVLDDVRPPLCSPTTGTPPQSWILSVDLCSSPRPSTRPFTEPLFRGTFEMEQIEMEQTLRGCALMPSPPT